MWGLFNGEHHAMMISEFDSVADCQALNFEFHLGGDCEEILTWNLSEWSDAVLASKIQASGQIDLTATAA